MSAALIVTAELGGEDFAWLDALRRRHYPPERNQLPAHLTMFHALAPSAEREIRDRLAEIAAGPAPAAHIAGIMDLGGGVALRVVSDDSTRSATGSPTIFTASWAHRTAAAGGRMSPSRTRFRRRSPRELIRSLEKEFKPRPLRIAGLGLHRYLGGPWETLALYKFRGAS